MTNLQRGKVFDNPIPSEKSLVQILDLTEALQGLTKQCDLPSTKADSFSGTPTLWQG